VLRSREPVAGHFPLMSDSEIRAENLKQLRKRMRLSQGEVAEIIGIAREAVSKIETGKRDLTAAERRLLEWYFFGKVPLSPHAFPMSPLSYRFTGGTFVWE